MSENTDDQSVNRPADEDRCGGRNTMTRFADADRCTDALMIRTDADALDALARALDR